MALQPEPLILDRFLTIAVQQILYHGAKHPTFSGAILAYDDGKRRLMPKTGGRALNKIKHAAIGVVTEEHSGL